VTVRRLAAWLALVVALGASLPVVAADPAKVLRVAFPIAETGFDPAASSDIYSDAVQRAIFEPLYGFDYVARPYQRVPRTAAALPEITDNGRVWTIRVKPGIRFADDPAFKAKPRELVAEDYVYSYKRWLDPNLRRGGSPITTDLIVGMRSVVDAARKSGKFDYDARVEGLRALDRYTLQLKLVEPNYPIIRDLFGFVGAVAREVVDAAGGDIRTRAVGTGPFRLREWKRGSRIVLDANPAYRRVHFPESGDPAQAGLVRSMQGKILPQIAVVEVNIIDEDLPRMLQFEQGGLDYIGIRGEVANRLLADGALKPEYARRGIVRRVFPEPFLFSFYFNVADPVIGGLSSERIALRRAIAAALDVETLVKVVYAGYALPANQIVPPGVGGHDATLPAKPLYDPATAKALLDRFGYAKGADGYRNTPDGKPLTVTLTLRSGPVSREIQTLTKRDLDAVGIRTDYRLTPFQDAIKELERGQFQMYFGGFGGSPSGWPELFQLYSKQPQRVNISQFKLDEYDRAADAFLRSASDAGQVAAARKMTELARTYMPEMPTIFRLQNDFVQPWLLGFSPQVFSTYWKYLDIDLARRESGR